jgi:hypothetical protein
MTARRPTDEGTGGRPARQRFPVRGAAGTSLVRRRSTAPTDGGSAAYAHTARTSPCAFGAATWDFRFQSRRAERACPPPPRVAPPCTTCATCSSRPASFPRGTSTSSGSIPGSARSSPAAPRSMPLSCAPTRPGTCCAAPGGGPAAAVPPPCPPPGGPAVASWPPWHSWPGSLLYGQFVSRLTRLTAAGIEQHGPGTCLRLDTVPVLLPPQLAALVRAQLDAAPGNPGLCPLFAGRSPARPVAPRP